MNLTRTQTNEEIRRREEEILDRIIPTEIMDFDETFDEEETDNLSECRPYDLTIDQEEDFVWKDYQAYSSSLSEQEKPDEFINENTEEEDIQSLEPLNISYQNRQDKETVNSLSLTTEPDEQLDKARDFTELDVRWGYGNKHIKDEDKWEKTKTNQQLFEPTVVSSSLFYSLTTSQSNTDKIF